MADSAKKIVVGVTGGVAAYKAAEVVRRLQDRGFRVQVVMTRSAERFVGALTFAALTGEKVVTEMFSEAGDGATLDSSVEHIGVAQSADLLLIAPATADFLAKMAQGLANDFLSTTHLAFDGPVAVAPAMNVVMWEHAATQANLATLRDRGVHIIEPDAGALACGMVGPGRLAEPDAIAEAVAGILDPDAGPLAGKPLTGKPLTGKTVLITAGPTREPLDPVRYLTNRSSGKMGYALAEEARNRGGRVQLVTGPTALPAPKGVETIPVETARQMHAAVMDRIDQADYAVLAAAVSDYRPTSEADQKIKKNGAGRAIDLEENPDILAAVAATEGERKVIGFAAETEKLEEHARAKLAKKGCDYIVANLVGAAAEGTGFDSDENQGLILSAQGKTVPLARSTKKEMARRIWNQIT